MSTHPDRWRSLGVWAAALLSGAAALSYEICWARALVIPLGNSADSAALVLAGFMLGIALGARAAGELAERTRFPLRWYALLEAGLGAYALIAPALLGLLTQISTEACFGSPALAGGLRLSVALALIVLPGLAMGAALPLLVRDLTDRGAELRLRISITYGMNTLGAALGALTTGFWGIALFGVERCSLLAGSASVLAALVAWGSSHLGGAAPALDRASSAAAASSVARPRAPTSTRGFASIAAFSAGACMLGYEVAWSRLLTFVFGHDTYAFASLLTLVLLGLALGGMLQRSLVRFDQRRVTRVALFGMGASCLASYAAASALVISRGRDPFLLGSSAELSSSVWVELWRELAFTPILLLLPSVCSGVVFAAACSSAAPAAGRSDSGRIVGQITLANGLGSGAGALVTSWGLVPLLGLHYTLLALSLCLALVALLWGTARLPDDARPRRWTSLAGAGALLVVFVVMPRDLPKRMLHSVVGERYQELLHYEEGRAATVSVIENRINDERQLLINAVNEVTTRLVHDQSFKLLGQLGPLLHPEPKRAVMICLGAGLAAGSALSHPLERLDVVDLSEAVVRGARYFEAENNGVLDHPAFHLHHGDGRRFLLDALHPYELAIIDSTHPKSVDSWILYTREFYQLVRQRLTADGIVVQWLPLHGLSEHEFKIIVRTFADVFPELMLWANVGFETYGQVGYAKLVGAKAGALSVDPARLAERLARPAVQHDLARFGMGTPAEVLDAFIASGERVLRWTAGLPVQTDDHPIVPYNGEHARGRPMLPALLLGVLDRAGPPLSRALDEADREELARALAAQAHVIAGDLEGALALRPEGTKLSRYAERKTTSAPYYLALADLHPDDPVRLFEAATQLASLGSPEHALALFDRALALRPKDFPLRLNRALLLQRLGDSPGAERALSALRDAHPRSALVHYNLGSLALDAGQAGVAARHLSVAHDLDPGSLPTRLALARASIEAANLSRARALLAELRAEHPFLAHAALLEGIVHELEGERALAIEAFCAAERLDPFAGADDRLLALGAGALACPTP